LVADKQDPISFKSLTRYMMMRWKAPLLCASKIPTQISFSVIKAEYIALSQAMQDLIPIREVLKEIMSVVFQVPKISYQGNSNLCMKTIKQINTIFHYLQYLKTMMLVLNLLECLS
jgi:hypothetical protein